jgi:alcohol dehydrogenase (NADP+)
LADAKNWSEFSLHKYPSKKWEETDVEVDITHCGCVPFALITLLRLIRLGSVCGSDVHTLSAGWGNYETPCVVGHEIVGIAKRVGSAVKGIKVGDRVGVGAQIASCYECDLCQNNNENYCPGMIDTYVRRPC